VTSDSALGDGSKLKAQAPNLVLGLRWMRKCRIPPATLAGGLRGRSPRLVLRADGGTRRLPGT
jgi:hypothetical protein